MTSSGTERQSWDETWFMVAQVIAQRSLCVRDKVGAVIVDKSNRIVATGYNGPPTGFVHNDAPCAEWCGRARKTAIGVPHHELWTDYADCPSNHAEANALSVCDRSARVGGTIYVTSHSCMGCAKLIANSGLTAIYVRPKTLAAHRDPLTTYDFLEKCGIDVYVS